MLRYLFTCGILLTTAPWALASPLELDQGLLQIQQAWAVANYQTPKDQQDERFTQLTAEADALVRAFPEAAEPKIWKAIVLSSHAGATGGFSALGRVKEARALLEAAERIDATALEGSVYTSLGSLYYQVPRWPIGFGDKARAEAYLKRALEVSPTGIDPNYFYGDFLLQQHRYQEAVQFLSRALKAPARVNRPLADEGRRAEAERALAKAEAELRG